MPWMHDHVLGTVANEHHHRPKVEEGEDVLIELDADVIWSWYTLSSSLKLREVNLTSLTSSYLRLIWALAIHALGAAMVWSVFINASTKNLAGGRTLATATTFNVYIDACKGVNVTAVHEYLEGMEDPFWNMQDRLWLKDNAASALFSVYNADQPDASKIVADLCWEEGCKPTAITAVNGETNAYKMEEIIFSFLSAFCDLSDVDNSLLIRANEVHYASGLQNWTQLSAEQQRYWQYLGWTEASFDEHDPLACQDVGCIPQPLYVGNRSNESNSDFVYWDSLTTNQQFSAGELGWTKILWDAGDNPRHYLAVTCQNYLERNAIFGFVQGTAFVLMSLAVMSEYRNFVTAMTFALGIEKRATARVLLVVVASAGYLAMPIFVQCASALVIFDSGNELNTLQDSLALLFILEINNYLQFVHNPSSSTWSISMPPDMYLYVDKVRDWFQRIASVTIIAATIPLGVVFTQWPFVLVHPVWIFNPTIAVGPASAFMAGGCVLWALLVTVLLRVCGNHKVIQKASDNEDNNAVVPLPGSTAWDK